MSNRSNGNIEVLRCVLMFFIVLMHCATFLNTGNAARARMIHTFCIFSVNAFVLISGWFGVRFSVRKVIKIMGIGLYSSIVLFMLSPLAGKGFQFSYSLGWFGNAYVGLLILSPFINAGIDSLRRESERKLQLAWFAYAVAMVFSWLPLECLNVNLKILGWEAHSLNQLCFMYVTGRVLAGMCWVKCMRLRVIFVWLTLFMSLNFLWAILTGLTRGNQILQTILVGNRCYNNPIIILLSVFFFLLFMRLRFSSLLVKVCGFLGPSMFGVYLLHEATNHAVSVGIYRHCMILGGGQGLLWQYGTIIGAAVVVFGCCTVLDIVRRLGVSLVNSKERSCR